MRRRVTTLLLIALFLAGLAVLSYPFISNQWNQRVMSRAVEAYEDTTQTLSAKDYDRYWKGAEAYNQILSALGSDTVLLKPEMLVGYEDQLDVSGTGIMGYLTIEKINLQLPIYHGTDASVLLTGAGHLQGSSLPIGGENTHSVLSAHRGLPSALLFTRLDELEEGDTFTITVLGRRMTYEVDRITIILPTEFDELAIKEGQDLCTLMTCTPYGINTHRLLVRGVRTENAEDPITVRADAVRLDSTVAAVFLGIPLLLFLIIRMLIRTRKRKTPGKKRL